jgi:hypothetical protein
MANREVFPAFKIESMVVPIVGINDLRLALAQEANCPIRSTNIDRLPEPVQNKHTLINRSFHLGNPMNNEALMYHACFNLSMRGEGLKLLSPFMWIF